MLGLLDALIANSMVWPTKFLGQFLSGTRERWNVPILVANPKWIVLASALCHLIPRIWKDLKLASVVLNTHCPYGIDVNSDYAILKWRLERNNWNNAITNCAQSLGVLCYFTHTLRTTRELCQKVVLLSMQPIRCNLLEWIRGSAKQGLSICGYFLRSCPNTMLVLSSSTSLWQIW